MRTPTFEHLSDSSHEARVRRVINLREATGLTRHAFAKKHNLPVSSLQNWEDPKGNGLTEKGAKKLAMLFSSEGISCTPEWLLHGIGLSPQINSNNFVEELSQKEDNKFISEELNLFYNHYKSAIDLVIIDDGMLPYFSMGEHVAGVRQVENDIQKLIGENCIVQLLTGEILVRLLKKGTLLNHYTLTCINSNTTVSKPTLYDVELISAASIIWRRKPNTL